MDNIDEKEMQVLTHELEDATHLTPTASSEEEALENMVDIEDDEVAWPSYALSKEKEELILKPFPTEALSSYGGAKKLTSIKAQYIVERLNDVFGVGQWMANYVTEFRGEVMTPSAEGEKSIYSVIMACHLSAPGIETVTHFGGASLKKGQDLNDIYKSAATDALTKCASQIGIGNDVFKGLVQVDGTYKKGYTPRTNSYSGAAKPAAAGEDLSALLN